MIMGLQNVQFRRACVGGEDPDGPGCKAAIEVKHSIQGNCFLCGCLQLSNHHYGKLYRSSQNEHFKLYITNAQIDLNLKIHSMLLIVKSNIFG